MDNNSSRQSNRLEKYDHQSVEKKWQTTWQDCQVYKTNDQVKGKQNDYTLVEFAYPSGNLHIGHWYAFALPDIYVRYRRMLGYNTLYPFGFDSFGLPAENAAIKRGLDPRKWTYENIDYMRNQLRSMGTTFDWSREVVTSDPEYYKWNQWIFTQFFEQDIAYRSETDANWCEHCKTVLANEQVVNGECERCGNTVTKKTMKGWSLRITDFADELIDDLDNVDWPEHIKQSQKNWIGRSEGAEVDFEISFGSQASKDKITVFTTRADTLFGVTYVVLAPEHDLVEKLIEECENKDEVEAYIEKTKSKTELERQENKEKTGVELVGITATNPANGESVPVWIADYVLAGYGTGAVMAVPAHDERDFEFAVKFRLPVKQTVAQKFSQTGDFAMRDDVETLNRRVVDMIIEHPTENKFLLQTDSHTHFVGGGVDDGEDLMESAKREVVEETGFTDFDISPIFLEHSLADGFRSTKNKNQVTSSAFYHVKLRSLKQVPSEVDEGQHTIEWVDISKVEKRVEWPWHLWGWDAFMGKVSTEKGILVNSGQFDGMESDEAKKAITEFVCGRMTNTYRLRDWSVARQRYWGTPIPIVYDPTGNPHAVPADHLPWTLPDDVDHTPDGTAPLARSEELRKRTVEIFGEGWTPEVDTFDTFVDSSWYFLRYLDSQNDDAFANPEKIKNWMPVDIYMGGAEHTTMHVLYSRFWIKAMHKLGLVPFNEPYKVRINRGLVLGPDGNKMSKSKGNVIDPDSEVEKYGSDTVRTYLAFMGPYTGANYPWNPDSVAGVKKFLDRVWRMQEKLADTSDEIVSRELHKTIKKVGSDYSEYKFNTAISSLMTLLNTFEKNSLSKSDYQLFLMILSPLVPHLTEEIWHVLGNNSFIVNQPWPQYDESLAAEDSKIIGIQINGKVRGEISVGLDETEESVMTRVGAMDEIQKWMDGEIRKVIYKPGRILNIIVS